MELGSLTGIWRKTKHVGVYFHKKRLIHHLWAQRDHNRKRAKTGEKTELPYHLFTQGTDIRHTSFYTVNITLKNRYNAAILGNPVGNRIHRFMRTILQWTRNNDITGAPAARRLSFLLGCPVRDDLLSGPHEGNLTRSEAADLHRLQEQMWVISSEFTHQIWHLRWVLLALTVAFLVTLLDQPPTLNEVQNMVLQDIITTPNSHGTFVFLWVSGFPKPFGPCYTDPDWPSYWPYLNGGSFKPLGRNKHRWSVQLQLSLPLIAPLLNQPHTIDSPGPSEPVKRPSLGSSKSLFGANVCSLPSQGTGTSAISHGGV